VDAEGEFLGGGPQSNLSQHLIGEGAGHNERRMAGGATIRQPSQSVGFSGDGIENQKKKIYPKLTRRPSARRMTWRPEGIVKRSTCGLTLTASFALAFNQATSISMSK
jgi:hypothetical protein